LAGRCRSAGAARDGGLISLTSASRLERPTLKLSLGTGHVKRKGENLSLTGSRISVPGRARGSRDADGCGRREAPSPVARFPHPGPSLGAWPLLLKPPPTSRPDSPSRPT